MFFCCLHHINVQGLINKPRKKTPLMFFLHKCKAIILRHGSTLRVCFISGKPFLQRGNMNYAETHYLVLFLDRTKPASSEYFDVTVRLLISIIAIHIKNKKENVAASEWMNDNHLTQLLEFLIDCAGFLLHVTSSWFACSKNKALNLFWV